MGWLPRFGRSTNHGALRVADPSAMPVAQLNALSYQAASNPRTRPTTPKLPATGHLDEWTRYQLIARSQEAERNIDYYDATLGNFAMLLVGTGPVPRPLCGTAEWRQIAREEFMKDARRGLLDVRRRTSWGPWCGRLARSIVRDGEASVWHDGTTGAAQIWEAGRVKHIHIDAFGRYESFDTVDEQGRPSGNVPAANLTFCPWITRESQTHGHPVLAAGLDDWATLNSLYEAETVAAANAARVWTVIQSQSGAPGGGAAFANLQKGAATPKPASLSGYQYTENGAIMAMPPGLTATPWSPDRPNIDVPVYVKERMRPLVAPLGSYELLFLDISALNYAGIRGLKRLAQAQFSPWRDMILRAPIDIIWRNWCRHAILTKRIPYAADFDQVEWRWPDLPIQDREKDALADERELANGTASLQGIIGDDEWRRVQDEREAVTLRAAMLRLQTKIALQKLIDEAGTPLDAGTILDELEQEAI